MGKLKNKDIASALNISTAAVSMALNNKPGVSKETRQKVLAYYMQHSEASPLMDAGAAAKTLIFDIHKNSGDIIIDKPFFTEIMSSIEATAKEHGYLLMVSHYDPSTDLDEHIAALNAQGASGLLLLATEMTADALLHYKKLGIPYVLLDGFIDSIPCDAVTLDNGNAIFRAYEHAFHMGHRNIGYLKCSTEIPNFVHRFDGFLKARRMFEPELCCLKPVVFTLPANLKGSNLGMKKILSDLPEGFTLPGCFVSDLDFIAIGAMMAFRENGYAVPDDISVIGYDDIEFSAISSPPLTTIHLHQRTLARTAVDLLVNKIQNPSPIFRHIQIGSELIVRDSVKRKLPG